MAVPSRSTKASTFFKMMTGDFADRLQIPPAFVGKLTGLERSFPQEITVRNSTNRCWIVEINKFDNKIYFQDGWKAFVQDNSLERGDLLVFYYHGRQEFAINIWGKNYCEKEGGIPRKRRATDGTGMDAPEVIKLDPSSGSEESDEQDETIGGPMRQTKGAGNVAGKEFLEAVAYLRPSYKRNKNMPVPKLFRGYVKNHNHQLVKLQSSANKTWTVKIVESNGIFRFSGGWPKFVRANNFQPGDLLKFQLIDEKDVTFAVSILK